MGDPPLILYRGLGVPEDAIDEVRTSIETLGFSRPAESRFGYRITDLRSDIDRHFTNDALTTADTRRPIADVEVVCCCGDADGATYYAYANRYRRVGLREIRLSPLVVEFEASLSEVFVDDRDFLCRAFQLSEPQRRSRHEQQRGILADLFGKRVLRYFDRASDRRDSSFRVAMCELASQDADVVVRHHANEKVILGRYRTRFRSAFFVKAPIQSTQVRRVYEPRPELPAPSVTLEQFQDGSLASCGQ